MIAIDDLLATIPSLQRSDLEGWIRDELVIAAAGRRFVVLGHGMRPDPPHLHPDL